MNIRKATEQDIKRMMEIYAYARKFMAENGNPNQWGPTNWPPESLIRNGIVNKSIVYKPPNSLKQQEPLQAA